VTRPTHPNPYPDILTEPEMIHLERELDDIRASIGISPPEELKARMAAIFARLDRSKAARIKRSGLKLIKN